MLPTGNTPKATPIEIVARLAWLTAFVVPLLLALLLLASSSADATGGPGASSAPLFVEEEELEVEEGGELIEDTCGIAEEAFERGEMSEAELGQFCEMDSYDPTRSPAKNLAPEECLLRSATARVIASSSSRSVRLTLGYTTWEPTSATIEFGPRAGKGSARLFSTKRQLGRSGVIRLNKRLGDARFAKAINAGRYTVSLRIAQTPSYCEPFAVRKLAVKRASKSATTWSQKG